MFWFLPPCCFAALGFAPLPGLPLFWPLLLPGLPLFCLASLTTSTFSFFLWILSLLPLFLFSAKFPFFLSLSKAVRSILPTVFTPASCSYFVSICVDCDFSDSLACASGCGFAVGGTGVCSTFGVCTAFTSGCGLTSGFSTGFSTGLVSTTGCGFTSTLTSCLGSAFGLSKSILPRILGPLTSVTVVFTKSSFSGSFSSMAFGSLSVMSLTLMATFFDSAFTICSFLNSFATRAYCSPVSLAPGLESMLIPFLRRNSTNVPNPILNSLRTLLILMLSFSVILFPPI